MKIQNEWADEFLHGTSSNAYSEWVRQRREIVARSGLETLEPPKKMTLSSGRISLKFRLPVHGVSLVSIATRQ